LAFWFDFGAVEALMPDLALPADVADQVLAYLKARPGFGALASKAYAAEDSNFDILRRKPFTRLAMICALLPGLHRRFMDAGMPRQVWLDSIDDIRLRQRLYFTRTGKMGLAKGDARWYRHLMGFKLFKIGSLQFQPFEMLYLDEDGIGEGLMRFSEAQKKALPPGTPVLNTHIQYGANLEPLALAKTFEDARAFFRTYFLERDFKAFITYTWLLHPGLRTLLPEDSKILGFASLWEIVGQNEDKTQALERIFGGRRRRHADYPQETALQRAAVKDLGVLGYACGVISF
jgi:hypothetical protein